tara:strand:- start:165 stop:500 length:336 start_codon:yes stop_codon:yes gene_type:complete
MKSTQNKRIDEIEDQIETLEGQLTRVRKVTPLHDATWYVKWFGVFFICMAVLCRSIQEVPKIYDVCFSIIGTAAWLWVGIRWHDRALIVLNTILLAMLVSGGARYFVQWLI